MRYWVSSDLLSLLPSHIFPCMILHLQSHWVQIPKVHLRPFPLSVPHIQVVTEITTLSFWGFFRPYEVFPHTLSHLSLATTWGGSWPSVVPLISHALVHHQWGRKGAGDICDLSPGSSKSEGKYEVHLVPKLMLLFLCVSPILVHSNYFSSSFHYEPPAFFQVSPLSIYSWS